MAFPLTHGIEWLKGVALNASSGYGINIVVLIGFAVIGIFVSIRSFRFE
ncbi:hypothetical protein [Bacillus sp. JCM 19041]